MSSFGYRQTTIDPGRDQTIPCNTAMDKSNPNKVIDVAFSDTRDCLVSRGQLLNVRMVNLWQYSNFNNNRWGQLKASSSFNSSFQSSAHLLNAPANTADRISFPSNANLPSTIGASPMATIFRIRGLLSTVSSATCNNRGSLALSRCCKSEYTWSLGREAADWFNTSVNTRRSIISRARLSRLRESGQTRTPKIMKMLATNFGLDRFNYLWIVWSVADMMQKYSHVWLLSGAAKVRS